MSTIALFTLAVLLLSLVAMAREVLPADFVMLGALVVLVAAGAVELETALQGFANPTLVTVGALFVVAAALRESGALQAASDRLFGNATGVRGVLLRLTTTATASSAFLNNTAIVAMGIPTVMAWCRKRGLPASKLLMPLSFASIFGGLCTLIGTSTNLVADALLRDHGLPGLGFFEIAIVGLPCAAVGLAYLVLVGPRWLPARRDLREAREADRQDEVHVRLTPDSELVNRSAREAGIDDVPNLALVGISRPPRVSHAVGLREPLRAGDRITFRRTGAVDEETALRLRPRAADHDEAEPALREVVIPAGSSLVDETVRGANVSGRYGATVRGVRRAGADIEDIEGDFALRGGDALLLEMEPGEAGSLDGSTDLVAVDSEAHRDEPAREAFWDLERRLFGRRTGIVLCVGSLAAVVLLATLGATHISLAALGAAVFLVATRVISPGNARRSIDWSVLLVIGSALGVGAALESSGAASAMGDWLVSAGSLFGRPGLLVGVVVATMGFSLLISNTAAIAMMYPIVMSAAESAALDPRPLVIAATVSASLAFATPVSYQTNLMVYGPGGYRFSDFVRFGLPLQLLLALALVLASPLL